MLLAMKHPCGRAAVGQVFTRGSSMTGERPLAVQAGQLAALARYLKTRYGAETYVNLSQGRTEPTDQPRRKRPGKEGTFWDIQSLQAISSLGELLAKPVNYLDVPEAFALGLYKSFDISVLEGLAR
jgi:hypothetical protein